MNIIKMSKESRDYSFKVLGIIPVIIALLVAVFIPTRFPLAFEDSGAVMVYAGKIDLATIPIASFLVSLFMGFISKLAVVTKHKNDDDVLVGTISFLLLVFMNLANIYYLQNALRNTIKTGDIAFDAGAFLTALVGGVMLALSLVYLRVPFGEKPGYCCTYAMENEAQWKETQLFVGKILKGSGLVLMIIGAFLYQGIAQLVYLPVILVLNAVVLFFYNKKSIHDKELDAALEEERKAYRREKFEEKKRLNQEAQENLESYIGRDRDE